MKRRLSLLLALVPLACAGDDASPSEDATTASTPATTTGPEPTTASPTSPSADTGPSDPTAATDTTATPPLDGSDDDGSEDTGRDPTGAQCQADQQDCPDGHKCVLRLGAADWEFVCLPVLGDGQPGDACMHDGVIDGTDNCDQDSWCIGPFDTTGQPWEGICYPLCVGDMCDAPEDVCVGIGQLPVCAASCDPLVPGSCGSDESCILRGYEEGFVCFPSAADESALGEVCQTGISCESGLHCSQNVAGCAPADYCCTDFCDVDDTDYVCAAAAAGAECAPIGVVAPGQEHVGACVVP